MAAWMRQRVPLVAGTPTSPLERVLVAADSGSGVSAAIEHKGFTAINADLTVSVHRPLEGEWVGLDCLSIYEPHGVGLADTRLHDMHGPIGRALQSLLVRSEEHTSELQSRLHLVCRLLLEKKKSKWSSMRRPPGCS